ncbi:hypothetical protein L9F63_000760, partial [Diploptera punctata]
LLYYPLVTNRLFYFIRLWTGLNKVYFEKVFNNFTVLFWDGNYSLHIIYFVIRNLSPSLPLDYVVVNYILYCALFQYITHYFAKWAVIFTAYNANVFTIFYILHTSCSNVYQV